MVKKQEIVNRIAALCLWLIGMMAVIVSVPVGFLSALINPKSAFNHNMLISYDQLGNTVFGGDPDETISSRAAKNKDTSLIARILCKILSLAEVGHCEKSIEEDEGKDDLFRKS